jgi:acetyl esterase/lipase
MITRRFALLGIAALSVCHGCSPIAVLNTLAPSSTYRRTRDVAYGPDARMRLDIYQPAGVTQAAPVVVFFYGGSWSSGRREDYLFVGEALASRGIVTVLADYRLYPQVRYPEFLEDCAAALAWTFTHIDGYGGDPLRVVVAGHSAGAYNAAMLALDGRWLGAHRISPARLAGFVGLAGPYNFLPITGAGVKLIFNDPYTPLDSQPVAHVHPGAPAALLLAAMNDRFVFPDRNTQVLAEKLREAGDQVTVNIYPGLSHTTLIGAMSKPLRGLAPVLDDFSAFVLARGPVAASSTL